LIVLDPRIGFSAFRGDSDDDPELQEHIDKSLDLLRAHYSTKYAATAPNASEAALPAASSATQSPRKYDFTARYKKSSTFAPARELDEFLRLPSVAWEGCDPIQWWSARRTQFPTLSRLARDIFTIPGRFDIIVDIPD
jgi:hypothetical protein